MSTSMISGVVKGDTTGSFTTGLRGAEDRPTPTSDIDSMVAGVVAPESNIRFAEEGMTNVESEAFSYRPSLDAPVDVAVHA
jgi:hypothetical protein